MNIRAAALAALLGVLTTPLHAQQQEFSGEFHLGFASDAGGSGSSKREIGVVGELRAGTFGGQADYTNFRLNGVGQSSDAYGLHLNFSPSFGSAVGGFYTHETGPTFGATSYYGAEAQFGFQQGTAEGYIGIIQRGGGNGTLYGIRGDIAAQPNVDVFATADHVGFTGTSVNRFGLGGAVTVGERFDLSAEIGTSSVNTGGATRSGAYIGLKGAVTFGNSATGPTFERRGLLDRLPGF